MMAESHNIGVKYTETDLDNTFKGKVPSLSCIILLQDSIVSKHPISKAALCQEDNIDLSYMVEQD
jgi:hypothetical protein